MKIVCVCGLGMGTSLIMKMTVDKAARELGLDAEVEHWDAGTVGSKEVDLIVAAEDFAENLAAHENVILVKNILDGAEVKKKLEAYLADKGGV